MQYLRNIKCNHLQRSVEFKIFVSFRSLSLGSKFELFVVNLYLSSTEGIITFPISLVNTGGIRVNSFGMGCFRLFSSPQGIFYYRKGLKQINSYCGSAGAQFFNGIAGIPFKRFFRIKLLKKQDL